MDSRILIIEDDDRIRETTRMVLEDEGYAVDEAVTAEEGLAIFEQQPAACVLVDLMLPAMDGFDCCRRIRSRSDVPILIVTARGDSFDVVAGLEAGADDYVVKPFEPKELSARIRALLRRAHRFPSAGDGGIVIGDLEIRPEEGVVRKAGSPVQLTRTEFRLLCEMAAHPGRVFTREALLDLVWGYPYLGDGKLVDTHVYRLRAKIEANPAEPVHVLTVRGLGYKVRS